MVLLFIGFLGLWLKDTVGLFRLEREIYEIKPCVGGRYQRQEWLAGEEPVIKMNGCVSRCKKLVRHPKRGRMLRGKSHLLTGSSPRWHGKVSCGSEISCNRCRAGIQKGEDCYDVPQPKKPHSATRRFCAECFAGVLEQTRQDLENLEGLA